MTSHRKKNCHLLGKILVLQHVCSMFSLALNSKQLTIGQKTSVSNQTQKVLDQSFVQHKAKRYFRVQVLKQKLPMVPVVKIYEGANSLAPRNEVKTFYSICPFMVLKQRPQQIGALTFPTVNSNQIRRLLQIIIRFHE